MPRMDGEEFEDMVMGDLLSCSVSAKLVRELQRARDSESRLIDALKIALSHVVSGRRLDTTWEDIARAALKGAE